jgi:pimeloyl-ACP methyl ester carboxylesterase
MRNNAFRLVILVLILGLTSCHNLFKDDKKDPELKYLVNYEMVRSYPLSIIQAMINSIEGDFPGVAELRHRATNGIIVYEITYKTTFKGESVLASGLVSVPAGTGTYDMISYQNGTTALHSHAPTADPDRELFRLIEAVASTGFVVSLPDYLGFGESENMVHPYLHKASTVQSVLDMIRAVKELAQIKEFQLTNDLYLAGYSMGGWATLGVQREIENKHSNEFNLKASVPAAGPFDLKFTNQEILEKESYPMPYFIGFMINTYEKLEETTTPVNEILNHPYDSLVTVLFDGKRSGEDINALLTTNVAELFTENYRLNYDTGETFASFRSVLEANSIEPWNVKTPTMLIHSTADELVPFSVSQKTRLDLLAAGTPEDRVHLVPLPNLSHNEGITASGILSIKWFLDLTE